MAKKKDMDTKMDETKPARPRIDYSKEKKKTKPKAQPLKIKLKEPEQNKCPGCGKPRAEWAASDAYRKDGILYCCKNCAPHVIEKVELYGVALIPASQAVNPATKVQEPTPTPTEEAKEPQGELPDFQRADQITVGQMAKVLGVPESFIGCGSEEAAYVEAATQSVEKTLEKYAHGGVVTSRTLVAVGDGPCDGAGTITEDGKAKTTFDVGFQDGAEEAIEKFFRNTRPKSDSSIVDSWTKDKDSIITRLKALEAKVLDRRCECGEAKQRVSRRVRGGYIELEYCPKCIPDPFAALEG